MLPFSGLIQYKNSDGNVPHFPTSVEARKCHNDTTLNYPKFSLSLGWLWVTTGFRHTCPVTSEFVMILCMGMGKTIKQNVRNPANL